MILCVQNIHINHCKILLQSIDGKKWPEKEIKEKKRNGFCEEEKSSEFPTIWQFNGKKGDIYIEISTVDKKKIGNDKG